MSAPQIIKDLVVKFGQNIAQYKSGSYNEMETRVEFLNPFWKELGWDMDNQAGYALNYRDVIHEDTIRIKGTSESNSKAPDYAFRIGGVRKFFLEAKKPSVVIKTDASPAYQLRCYGWSCGLSLSVLSDFEEFAVYDCRIRPYHTDKASVARIKYITYTEYVDRWDEIAEIFHRENILKGSFDRFVESKKSKAGTSEVDEEFLKEIEMWRYTLANDLAHNNQDLSVHDLNFAVQRTIDRIIFLRMAEDRGIEPEDQLADIITRPDVYRSLQNVFITADQKYNSGFFHFTPEAEIPEKPDTLTPFLKISDKVLQEIIKRQYPPLSPYKFDVFPVEILGNVYERFLGSEIRLTPTRMAKVELKPEVRKAGGVYYTPGYIVDYIVEKSVGKLCEGKTPKQVSALKILDPACGSGSFLLGAYKYLLEWHLEWYVAEYERKGKIPQSPPTAGTRKKKSDPNAILQTTNGSWGLTLAERKRILLNNIYGVDLDAQAVEVTKLSLSLAVLEGMNKEMLESNLRLFYDRALPNLASNIKCGNSLIASDFYDDYQLDLFDAEQQLKINAFDWNDPVHGFGAILKSGGFDAVIGNPPYVRHELLPTTELDYYHNKFRVFNAMGDLFTYFYEQGFRLLNQNGVLSFISNTFTKTTAGETLRRFIAENKRIESLLDLTSVKVFRDATTYPIVMVLHNNYNDTNNFDYIKIPTGTDFSSEKISSFATVSIPQNSLQSSAWNFHSDAQRCLIEKIQRGKTIRELYGKCYRGIVTGYNHAFIITKEIRSRLIHEDPKSKELIVPLYEGKDIQKWRSSAIKKYMIAIYPSRQYDINDYPAIKAYLLTFGKQRLNQNGAKGSRKLTGHKWFETQDSICYWQEMGKNKIIWTNLQNTNRFSFDDRGYTVCAPACILPTEDKALLGILNSKVVWKILTNLCVARNGGYIEVKPQYFEQIPIPEIPKEIRAKLERQVEELIAANDRLPSLTNPQESELIQRRIGHLDRQIDSLVYDLYGLTDEERKLCDEIN